MKTQTIISVIIALLLATFLGSSVDAATQSFEIGIAVTGLSFAASFLQFTPQGALFLNYVKVNVDRPSGIAPGAGGDKKDKIIFIDSDDVLTMPSRDNKGIVITGNIVMKSNAYMTTIYATPGSIKNTSNSEGEIDAEGIMQGVEFSHPGMAVAIREFRANWLGRNVMVIVEHCKSTTKDLYGSPCAPLRMQFAGEDSKDKNGTVFTFKSSEKGPDVADYQGTLTYSTVTDTVAADETEIDLTNGEGRYQLTDGTASAATITTCTDAVDGMVFTVLGSGGTYPSQITAANDFILAGGVTWTATSGSQITCKAFKDGGATWKFIEISRS
jgi:hypothetical protein